MMAAGKAIDPFWNLYRQHYNTETAKDYLAEMKIGVLDPSEKREEVDETNPYSKDPQRHPGLKFHRFDVVEFYILGFFTVRRYSTV